MRLLDEIFEEIAAVVADIPNEEQLQKEVAKDIMNKHALCYKERNFLCNRISKELGIEVNP